MLEEDSNHSIRPPVRPSVRPSVRPRNPIRKQRLNEKLNDLLPSPGVGSSFVVTDYLTLDLCRSEVPLGRTIVLFGTVITSPSSSAYRLSACRGRVPIVRAD